MGPERVGVMADIAVCYGTGSSLDTVPLDFIGWTGAHPRILTLCCCEGPLVARFQDAGLVPDVYCALDRAEEGASRELPRALRDSGWQDRCAVFLGNSAGWDVPEATILDGYKRLKFSGQALGVIAAREYGCKEIWLIGMDCGGPHCELRPDIYRDTPAERRGWWHPSWPADSVEAWRTTVKEFSGPAWRIIWRVWSRASPLYPIVTLEVVEESMVCWPEFAYGGD